VDENVNHPGYYRLAYDFRNLLPSCSLCNESGAKLTHSPVDGAHARDSRGLPNEKPLLLNPYERDVDPFAHLEFDPAGRPQPCNSSPRGETSRTIYYLERPGLSEARLAMMWLVEQDWNTRISRNVGILTAFNQLRDDILNGEREYAAAQFWELERIRKRTFEGLAASVV
jgi:hypothetical protein